MKLRLIQLIICLFSANQNNYFVSKIDGESWTAGRPRSPSLRFTNARLMTEAVQCRLPILTGRDHPWRFVFLIRMSMVPTRQISPSVSCVFISHFSLSFFDLKNNFFYYKIKVLSRYQFVFRALGRIYGYRFFIYNLFLSTTMDDRGQWKTVLSR